MNLIYVLIFNIIRWSHINSACICCNGGCGVPNDPFPSAEILKMNDGQCLEVFVNVDKTYAVLHNCDDSDNQKWDFVSGSSQKTKIKHLLTGKCLYVFKEGEVKFVDLTDCDGANQWVIKLSLIDNVSPIWLASDTSQCISKYHASGYLEIADCDYNDIDNQYWEYIDPGLDYPAVTVTCSADEIESASACTHSSINIYQPIDEKEDWQYWLNFGLTSLNKYGAFAGPSYSFVTGIVQLGVSTALTAAGGDDKNKLHVAFQNAINQEFIDLQDCMDEKISYNAYKEAQSELWTIVDGFEDLQTITFNDFDDQFKQVMDDLKNWVRDEFKNDFKVSNSPSSYDYAANLQLFLAAIIFYEESMISYLTYLNYQCLYSIDSENKKTYCGRFGDYRDHARSASEIFLEWIETAQPIIRKSISPATSSSDPSCSAKNEIPSDFTTKISNVYSMEGRLRSGGTQIDTWILYMEDGTKHESCNITGRTNCVQLTKQRSCCDYFDTIQNEIVNEIRNDINNTWTPHFIEKYYDPASNLYDLMYSVELDDTIYSGCSLQKPTDCNDYCEIRQCKFSATDWCSIDVGSFRMGGIKCICYCDIDTNI